MRVWIPVEAVSLPPSYAMPPYPASRRPWIGMNDLCGGLLSLLLAGGLLALLVGNL